jgi:hypothetical protein
MSEQEQERPRRYRLATGDTVHSHHATRASAKLAKDNYLGATSARIECTTDAPDATVIRWLPDDDTAEGQS